MSIKLLVIKNPLTLSITRPKLLIANGFHFILNLNNTMKRKGFWCIYIFLLIKK